MAAAEDIVNGALSQLSILRIGGVANAAQSAAAMGILTRTSWPLAIDYVGLWQ